MSLFQSRCNFCNLTTAYRRRQCPNCGRKMLSIRRNPEYRARSQRNPEYRRNSDDELRQAERKFQAEPRYETLTALNLVRQRLGRELIPDPRQQLKCGLSNEIPFGVNLAWGSRAILEQNGADMVYIAYVEGCDTIGPTAELKDQLIRDLNQNNLIPLMQTEIRRLLKLRRLRSDENKTHTLVDRNNIIILGNTNASHGYLYLVAFYKPDGWQEEELRCVCEQIIDAETAETCIKCANKFGSCCENPCDNCDSIVCKKCIKQCKQCDLRICENIECQKENPIVYCEDCYSVICDGCSVERVKRVREGGGQILGSYRSHPVTYTNMGLCEECQKLREKDTCEECGESISSGDCRCNTCENCGRDKEDCECEESDDEDEESDDGEDES